MQMYCVLTYLGYLAMEINHFHAKHVAKLAYNFLVPRIILQTDFRLNLHNA